MTEAEQTDSMVMAEDQRTLLHSFTSEEVKFNNHRDLQRSASRRRWRARWKRLLRGFTSGLAHIGFLSAIVVLIYLPSSKNQRPVWHYVVPAILLIVSYIVILIEARFSNTLSSLRNFSTSQTILDHVDQVTSAPPKITWTAECYHYESGAVADNSILGKENETAGKKSRRRVVTRTETQQLALSDWSETSRDIRTFVSEGIIRLESSKIYLFKSDSSKALYMEQLDAFRERCRQLDQFVDHSETFEVEGFLERITAGFDRIQRPNYMQEKWYWVCTACLGTWIYRAIFKLKTTKIYMLFIKEI